MLKDWRDQPVSGSHAATVDGINTFVEGFLGYENKAATILATADEDPGSAIANTYAAMFCMFLESKDAFGPARAYIDRAEKALGGANDRERLTFEAVRAWVDSDIHKAIAIGEELASDHPRELAVAKTTQYHYFNLGDAPGMLRISEKILKPNEDLAYAHGLAAFAYEQAHLIDQAETAANRAIALQRKEPWAHHALAHVFLSKGETGESRRFLEDVKETWTDLNSFMLTHNYWHLALVMIDEGDLDAALSLYDNNIWGVWKEYSQDQIGAVSMLARLELAGMSVGERWQDVAQYLKVRVDDHVQPFLSAQYLYGLARAGMPEADTMMDSIKAHSEQVSESVSPIWKEVAVPLCEGLIAYARRDYEEAFRKLGPILCRLTEIGGSHAQRDLFDQIWLDSLIRTKRLGQAQGILEQRRAASPEAKPNYGKLAILYDHLALHEEAHRVMTRARLAAAST